MTTHTRRALEQQGLGSRQIRHLIHDEGWIRLRRAGYADEATADEFARHRQQIDITMEMLPEGAVLSHTSAALLHGLPVQHGKLDRVTVTRPRSYAGHNRTWLHTYACPFTETEVTVLAGYPVTTIARTCIDLARASSRRDGVIVLDAGLAQGGSRETMSQLLDLHPFRPGNKRARLALEFADGRSESPGESASRVLLDKMGFPAPELQFQIWAVDGRLVARTDFAWPKIRLVGEFDGAVKYGGLLLPGQTPADVVMAEKRREQELHGLRWYVVRWGWADLLDEVAFGRRITEAMRIAAELVR